MARASGTRPLNEAQLAIEVMAAFPADAQFAAYRLAGDRHGADLPAGHTSGVHTPPEYTGPLTDAQLQARYDVHVADPDYNLSAGERRARAQVASWITTLRQWGPEAITVGGRAAGQNPSQTEIKVLFTRTGQMWNNLADFFEYIDKRVGR